METLKITLIGMVLLMSSAISFESFGQGPPPWAPAHGHRAKARQVETRYIYFPEHNFYYDMHSRVYHYADGPHWYAAPALPALYAWINLGNSMQVALDFRGERPYQQNHYHIQHYHYHDHHKAWKKQHKEWEKREKQWAKEYDKRHKKCGKSCRDYYYTENRRPERSNGRVMVDVRF